MVFPIGLANIFEKFSKIGVFIPLTSNVEGSNCPKFLTYLQGNYKHFQKLQNFAEKFNLQLICIKCLKNSAPVQFAFGPCPLAPLLIHLLISLYFHRKIPTRDVSKWTPVGDNLSCNVLLVELGRFVPTDNFMRASMQMELVYINLFQNHSATLFYSIYETENFNIS